MCVNKPRDTHQRESNIPNEIESITLEILPTIMENVLERTQTSSFHHRKWPPLARHFKMKQKTFPLLITLIKNKNYRLNNNVIKNSNNNVHFVPLVLAESQVQRKRLYRTCQARTMPRGIFQRSFSFLFLLFLENVSWHFHRKDHCKKVLDDHVNDKARVEIKNNSFVILQ